MMLTAVITVQVDHQKGDDVLLEATYRVDFDPQTQCMRLMSLSEDENGDFIAREISPKEANEYQGKIVTAAMIVLNQVSPQIMTAAQFGQIIANAASPGMN